MSIIGSLTTTYTPPPICMSEAQNVYHTDVWFYQGPTAESCFPDNYTADRDAYYSPAYDCPSGYTTACSSINTFVSPVETVVTCCPGIDDSRSFECISSALWDIHKTYVCSVKQGKIWTVTGAWAISDDGESHVEPTWTGSGGEGLNAMGVQLRFQGASPTPTPSSASSAFSDGSPATGAKGGSTANEPTSTAVSGQQEAEQDGGDATTDLTTGAVAGIAIACAVIGAIAASVLTLFLTRRRMMRNSNNHGYWAEAPEGTASTTAELNGVQKAHELHSPNNNIAELESPGDGHGHGNVSPDDAGAIKEAKIGWAE